MPNWVLGAVLKELRPGDRGNDVRALQMRLLQTGYPSINPHDPIQITAFPSGIFDEGTTNAIRAYQRANNLHESGVATTETLDKLFGGKLHEALIPEKESDHWLDRFWAEPSNRWASVGVVFAAFFLIARRYG